jgi:hypothetical protein
VLAPGAKALGAHCLLCCTGNWATGNVKLVKGITMTKFLLGSVALLTLAACGGGFGGGNTGSNGNEEIVCGQQSDWARSGTIDGGDMTITCPGNARPGY